MNAVRPPFLLMTWFSLSISLGAMAHAQAPRDEATPIVLRDLSLIRGKTISQFDDNAIQLSDGTQLAWDQVLKASVDQERQTEFDRRVLEIGLPVFRLKSRIALGDWSGAGEIAQPIYNQHILSSQTQTQRQIQPARSFDTDTKYLICLAAMHSSLDKHHHGQAMMPFFEAARTQPSVRREILDAVGIRTISKRELSTFFSDSIPPIWFDQTPNAEAEKWLLQQIQSIDRQREERDSDFRLPPGFSLYLASIQIESGQTATAIQSLQRIDVKGDANLNDWHNVLLARAKQVDNDPIAAQTLLTPIAQRLQSPARPLALFYLGTSMASMPGVSDSEFSRAMLMLLKLPALYGANSPELAAAALFQAAEIAKLRGMNSVAQKLREELLKRYPHTYHGELEKRTRLQEDLQSN
ncbi:MAG: hypothetical protein ACI814_003908 [Mariniblastus sp.]|jgi:hypothetical protein